jgi:type IV pilus assembly protein PilE
MALNAGKGGILSPILGRKMNIDSWICVPNWNNFPLTDTFLASCTFKGARHAQGHSDVRCSGRARELACAKRSRGFTLIELMVTVAIVGILASIAYPAYSSYIAKQRMGSAEADLVGLALNMESYLQNTTQYPAVANGATTIKVTLTGWIPVQTADFSYAISAVNNAAVPASYTLTATGTSSLVNGCVITLGSDATRTLALCTGGKTTW